MQEKQHSSCNPEIQNWALEVDVNCLGGPGVGAAAKQESGILVLWQRKNWKSLSWPAWCLGATWSWRIVTWSASLRHALCQKSTDGVQLADLRFHDFWQKTQWLAEIAGQRFWWKGGLRFFFLLDFWQLSDPNTWLGISEVGGAKNQCPNRAECSFFVMLLIASCWHLWF